MTPEESKQLARNIAEEIAANHSVCRLGLTTEQAAEIKSLANASVATRKIAGTAAVYMLVTAFFGFLTWAVWEKLKQISNS